MLQVSSWKSYSGHRLRHDMEEAPALDIYPFVERWVVWIMTAQDIFCLFLSTVLHKKNYKSFFSSYFYHSKLIFYHFPNSCHVLEITDRTLIFFDLSSQVNIWIIDSMVNSTLNIKITPNWVDYFTKWERQFCFARNSQSMGSDKTMDISSLLSIPRDFVNSIVNMFHR